MYKDKEKYNEYRRQYRKDKVYSFSIAFDKNNDKEVIAFLESLPSKNQFITSLVKQTVNQQLEKQTDN